jgi:hypothetical protein
VNRMPPIAIGWIVALPLLASKAFNSKPLIWLSFSLASAVGFTTLALASGWTAPLSLVSVTELEASGEVVQIVVSQPVDNSAGCQFSDAYMVRDANILKGSLALLEGALIAGRPIAVAVATTCDATGRPAVNAVQAQ